MTIFIIQLLNSFFYAAVLFLIAAGLSLIYGVMRIVNLAHGALYALGAYVSAWVVGGAVGHAASGTLGVAGLLLLLPVGAVAIAVVGAVIEPTLLRPLYRRPEEYHLLITFGLLMILEDAMKFLFGGTPLSAGSIMDHMGSIPIGRLLYPTYNLVVVAVGLIAALGLWRFIYRTKFGVILRATSQDRRMAAALGLNVGRVYVQAFAIGCFMAGLGGAVVVPAQAAVLGMGVDALVLAILVGLALLRAVVDPYQTLLITYGLIMAIAALGFNLLLGYTGLLSFGHSAYFGAGAYTVAFIVRDLGAQSMELCILGGLLGTLVISALFGFVCVRHTRIFFGILTLALSQVLWSLAFKFFWVTGGTDGLRVPTPSLLGGLVTGTGDKTTFMVHAYYYYVLAIFGACAALMWIIVNSPFGKALQAIRDNETRAEFVGVRIWRYRWVAFLVSGVFTGLAGALWVPLNGLTTPDIMHWTFSGEIVFMTVLGGFRSFAGPIIGAVVFNYLKTYAVGYTVYSQLLLGSVLVALVLSLPTGIVGSAGKLLARFQKAR